jgi:hypothetical protein
MKKIEVIPTVNYTKSIYDRSVFQAEYIQFFIKNPRYSSAELTISNLLNLLGLMERDTAIFDLRHIAYMLATVAWETTVPTTVSQKATNKKGQPLVDKKGQAIVVKRKIWQFSMSPVDEIGRGKGRKYHEPVKVKKLAGGGVQVTEQDGDQFIVRADGSFSSVTKGAKVGTLDGGAALKRYQEDDGVEHAYYGRGYVQLTWWSNYAAMSAAIGKGLDLLFDHELVKQREIAYALMSLGMLTGAGFANGKRLNHYINNSSANYVGARAIVNGSDHAADIAELAKGFERILLKARANPPLTRQLP